MSIQNVGDEAINLEGWTLRDISTGFPEFEFPSHILPADGRVRVYTNEVHPEHGGFSFGRGAAIWNNSDPDTAALFSPAEEQVSTKSYPPGC